MNKTVVEQPYLNHDGDEEVNTRRGIAGFVSFVFIICVLVGCAHFLYQGRFIGIAQLGILLMLGCFYTTFMQKRLLIIGNHERLMYSLAVASGLLITLSVLYFFKGDLRLTKALTLTSSFILPYVLTESWRLFSAIPREPVPIWQYSTDIPAKPIFIYLENQPITMHIVTGAGEPMHIASMAPLSLKLGLVFFYMIKEQNNTMYEKLLTDERKVPYGWAFYVTKYGLWKKYFNPEETLAENRIKKNTQIIAKRVQ